MYIHSVCIRASNLNIILEFILTDANNRHEKEENHKIARHVKNFFIARCYLPNSSTLMYVAT